MKRFSLFFIVFFLLLCTVFFYSLYIGSISIPISHVFSVLFDATDTLERRIIFETRLPRAFTGALTGASFALAGTLTQLITKNSMACPSLLGINQGAALGIVIAAALIPFSPLPILLIAAILGGFCASLFIFFIASSVQFTPFRLVLAGQAMNALLYALAQAFLIFLPTRSGVILINLNGSLAGTNWDQLCLTSPILFLCILFILINMKNIQLLRFNANIAQSVGFNPIKWRSIFFFFIMILSSISVGLVGPILFFPLIAVYCSKIFVGQNPYYLVPFSALFGAILMLVSDIFMRTLYPHQEIPVGFFVAVIGAPLLIISTKIQWAQKGWQNAS